MNGGEFAHWPYIGLLLLACLICWVVATARVFRKVSVQAGLFFIATGILTLWVFPLVVGLFKAREWRMVPIMAVWTALYLMLGYLILTDPILGLWI